MNTSLNTTISSAPLSLDKAKRRLELAVEACKVAAREAYKNINRDAPLDYFYPTSANLKSFQKLVALCNTGTGLLRDDSKFADLVISAVTQYQQVEELVAAEKARKAGKRAAVAAKAALKQDLNLQEGVKLQGVDVGQYQVILAGLEPVRLHVYENRRGTLGVELAFVMDGLRQVAGSKELYNPCPRRGTREQVETYKSRESFIRLFFNTDAAGICAPKTVEENRATLGRMAKQIALAYVQGYAVKLALKTGEQIANDPVLKSAPAGAVVEIVAASVSSTNLWQDSIANIHIRQAGCGATLTFHTQIIWNRSCLGKVFNQYPTRRV